MKSFACFVAFAALASSGYGLVARDPSIQKRTSCPSSSVVSTTTVTVGANSVEISTLSCGVAVTEDAAPIIFDSPFPVSAPAPADVCNELCTDLCSSVGPLPPVSEDCAVIVDAITILNGSVSPTFTVDPNTMQQLTFGTCRFFFENVSPNTLEYCWSALSNVASAAETACFPPVQPVFSQGLCVPTDGRWEVGVGHS
ncbi:hypothetical protein OBBRIDRAFT_835400 [Obba rivulosa]|uniref:Uncharacterized protein n=1 Tax=Obba rivulosa TaxID=1052685 RepID=A0A8E2AS44_9APHY|nr:hypothetical protein OBBRIDRAFT_835400 [Obba rivulosa]